MMHEVRFFMELLETIVTISFQLSPRLKVATNFACKLYLNELNKDNEVNYIQVRLFSQTSGNMERIPLASDALDQYLRRSVF